ncbi:MAG: transposase, partial [Pseudomonadota bacterium]|nr:transposase [Pseudomonadota bacterium]
LGQPDPVIVSHRRYLALGQSELQRQEVYGGLFTVHVNGGQLTRIREAWQTGTPLGNDRFKEQVEAMVGRKIGQARRGRPKKTPRKIS